MYGHSLTYAEFDKVGEALLQNVLMRTRDQLYKLYRSNAKNVDENSLYEDFYTMLEPIASVDRFRTTIIYNPSGARPDESYPLGYSDVRRVKMRMDELIAGGLYEHIAQYGADFTYLTTEQNDLLTSYVNDLERGENV